MSLLADEAKPAGRSAVSPPRLGEELPIFCERCGYSLHGLAPVRCDQCQILQFVCPECGHHQPINTLRPAVQRMLGRIRLWWLITVVLFKVNFFGWMLFAWFAMGVEWVYRFVSTGSGTYALEVRAMTPESWAAFALFGVAFGAVSRMLLLRRFPHGVLFGLGLSCLVVAAITLGAWFRAYVDLNPTYAEPFWNDVDFFLHVSWTLIALVLASAVVWPIWSAMAWALLPRELAKAMLRWQSAPSERTLSAIERV